MPSRSATRGRSAGHQHPGSQGVGPTAQGTLGGTARAATARYGVPVIGDEGYLWILVGLEVLATALLRRYFRRNHGG